MEITRGIVARAQKVVIYGVEGIGKSTLASQFPNPLFIDTEGSTDNMDVARLPRPTSYAMLRDQIEFVKRNPHVCKTLVIDTIDWAETLIIELICAGFQVTSLSQIGYGNGFIALEEELGRMLNHLSDLIQIGINVVLLAHAQIRKFELPDELGAFDKYELKLGKKTSARTSSLVKEWADMVLFCNYKTVVSTDKQTNKRKAQGNKRVMYTTHQASFDAKNRFGLPDELPLEYSAIAPVIEKNNIQPAAQQTAPVIQAAPIQEVVQPAIQPQPITSVSQPQSFQGVETSLKPDYIPQSLWDLMISYNVTEEEIKEAAVRKGFYPRGMELINFDPEFLRSLVAKWADFHSFLINEGISMPF